MTKTKFLLIDGNSLVHRAFHALPPLTTKKGVMVNAVYGFIAMYLKILREVKPTHVIVAFDRVEPTFRDKAFEPYKATRISQPQELYDQFDFIREFLDAMHVPSIDAVGFEADDVIGTLAHAHASASCDVLILSGDLDPLQLVSDHIKTITPKKGMSDTMVYDRVAVHERYGLDPEQLIDFKALKGDTSDNIPGVKGIGEKTAATLIQKFGSFEKMYHALEQNKKMPVSERVAGLLRDQKEMAELSRMLVTIRRDVPIKSDLKKAEVQAPDISKLSELFQEWQFMSLLKRVQELNNANEVVVSKKVQKEAQKIEDVDTLAEFLKPGVAIGAVTEGVLPFDVRVRAIGVAIDDATGVLESNSPLWPQALKFLGRGEYIIHDAKPFLHALANDSIEPVPVLFDTAIASYLITPGSRAHDLEVLAFTELGISINAQANGQAALLDARPLGQITAERARVTQKLHARFAKILEDRQQIQLLNEMELPLEPVLTTIERRGVKLDSDFIIVLDKKIGKKIIGIQEKVWKLAGEEFNIGSPLQLKKVLFENLKLSTKGIGKTKTGISTAAGELDKLRGTHKIIDEILEWRELTKLKNTYLESLPELVNKKTGRIHTTYNQIVAATGRLSSENPNLQNIPIRGELGREVRRAFIAEKRNVILAADYSQIELRIAAHIANDKEMIAAFARGEDIHAHTAAYIYGVDTADVTSEQRRHAKTLNFGVLYGMGVSSFARSTGLPREEAQMFIDQYFTVHDGIREYVEITKALARKLGYVETLFGRRRYLPEIKADHPMLRAGAERMAVNHPIQGTEADILKLAMIKIQKELPNLAMTMQVHDELVFEVPKQEAQSIAKKLAPLLENIIKLKVPMKVDISSGPTWGDLE